MLVSSMCSYTCLHARDLRSERSWSAFVQGRRSSGADVVEEQIFEHERFLPLVGWSSKNLLPTERNRYSRYEEGAQSTSAFPQIRLSDGDVSHVTSDKIILSSTLCHVLLLIAHQCLPSSPCIRWSAFPSS